jgi:hypothetical protein
LGSRQLSFRASRDFAHRKAADRVRNRIGDDHLDDGPLAAKDERSIIVSGVAPLRLARDASAAQRAKAADWQGHSGSPYRDAASGSLDAQPDQQICDC